MSSQALEYVDEEGMVDVVEMAELSEEVERERRALWVKSMMGMMSETVRRASEERDRLNRRLIRRCVGTLEWSLGLNEWCLGYEVRRAKYGRCGDEQADFEDDLYISFEVLLMTWIKHHISATCAHPFPRFNHKMLVINVLFSTPQLSDIEIVSLAYIVILLKEGSRIFPRLGV